MVRPNQQVGVRNLKRLLRKYQKPRPKNSFINCAVFYACTKYGGIVSGWKMIGMEAVPHCWMEFNDKIIDPTSEETTYFKNFQNAKQYITNERESLQMYIYHTKRIKALVYNHEMPTGKYSDGLVKLIESRIHTRIKKAINIA